MSDRNGGSWSFGRRTALELMGGVALGSAAAGTAAAGGRTRTERTCYVKQGDRAYEIEPLAGDVPVERLYDYRLPDEYEGVGVTSSEGPHYHSVGTQDLQVESTTVTFLYDGPDGLSLVVVHGRPDGEGGSVSWTIERVPRGAEWAVKDDLYVDADTGERAANNYDRWETDGDSHRVDWTWGSHGTDGGALSGLGETFSLTIHPRFNEDAELYGEHYSGRVEDWRILSGDLDDPYSASFDLDEPVTVACETTKHVQVRTRKWDDHDDWDDHEKYRDGHRKHRHGKRKKHRDERDREDGKHRDGKRKKRRDGKDRDDERADRDDGKRGEKRRGDRGMRSDGEGDRRGGEKRRRGDEKSGRGGGAKEPPGGERGVDGGDRRGSGTGGPEQSRQREQDRSNSSGMGRVAKNRSERQGLLQTILDGDD